MTRLSTKATTPPGRPLCRSSCPYHKEYITFKASINNIKLRKGGKAAAPHEHWKNIDFLKSAQFWNELVDGQSRAVTDSNQQLYYKLPLQLETHHKKVLSWNSERSTLANGINFTARKLLLNILNSADNHIDVLPAIPLPESVPDGEVDLSIAGSVDLNSFNLMAAPPDHGHSEFIESEQGGASSYTHHIAFDNAPGSDIDMPLYTPPMLTQPAPPMKQAVHQTLLPGANPTSASSVQKADRCAVCVNSMCRKRWDCPGNGNRASCKCAHPPIPKEKRVRISEETIIRYIAEQERGGGTYVYRGPIGPVNALYLNYPHKQCVAWNKSAQIRGGSLHEWLCDREAATTVSDSMGLQPTECPLIQPIGITAGKPRGRIQQAPTQYRV
ncbi:hypothetical protein C8R44DRAFT_751648 [Mycena epipterygia]|nr:hypothetical protein C8R44DRAFT_751648 [Mycena epipterygia]